MHPCLYHSRVMHQRFTPMQYQFFYRVINIFVNIDQLDELAKQQRWFSHNRFNVFSFYAEDHGPRNGQALRPWIEAHLTKQQIHLNGGDIYLFCFPRIFGYVFNPLSLWFCFDADKQLKAILCEVNNTFGEAHSYLLHASGAAMDFPVKQQHDKVFHVSPFINMNAQYAFTIKRPEKQFAITIDEQQNHQPLLIASQTAQQKPFSDSEILKAALIFPFSTLNVMFSIHWQALKIWLKGGRYHPKPTPPEKEISS